MSKFISVIGGVAYILVPVVTENGRMVLPAMREDFEKRANGANAETNSDFDSVETEINSFLLGSDRRTTIPTNSLISALYDARLESGCYVHPESTVKEKDQNGVEVERTISAHKWSTDEKAADRDRLDEVVRAFLRSKPDQFHLGGKGRGGVAIRFVKGETMKDPKTGEVLYGTDLEPVQAYRFSDEDWKKFSKKSDDAPVSVK